MSELLHIAKSDDPAMRRAVAQVLAVHLPAWSVLGCRHVSEVVERLLLLTGRPFMLGDLRA